MKLRVLPYVTVEIDDRLRRRVRRRVERVHRNVRAHLLSAVDDVDAAGDRVRGLCDRAVTRVDTVVASVNDRIAPESVEGRAPSAAPRLRIVDGREAS
jgi:hypothetical protein